MVCKFYLRCIAASANAPSASSLVSRASVTTSDQRWLLFASLEVQTAPRASSSLASRGSQHRPRRCSVEFGHKVPCLPPSQFIRSVGYIALLRVAKIFGFSTFGRVDSFRFLLMLLQVIK